MEDQPLQTDLQRAVYFADAGLSMPDLDTGKSHRKSVRILVDSLGDHVIGPPSVGQAFRLDAARCNRDDRLVDARRIHLGKPCLDVLTDAVGHRAPDMGVNVDDLTLIHACASSSVSLRPSF